MIRSRAACALVFALLAQVFACTAERAGAPSPSAPSSPSTPAPSAPALAWTAGPPLTASRDHHATFLDRTAAGSFLYVVGGTTAGPTFLADAWRARITADGAVEAWTPATALPTSRAGMGVVVDGHHVVLVGGKLRRAKEQTASVVLGAIGADGALGPWREGAPLPAPRFHLTSTLARGYVFAVGGLDDASTSTSTVFRAPLLEGGSVGPWTEARALPDTRSHHAAFARGEWLFVLGGLRGNPLNDEATTLADVVRAHVEADGSLGPWTTVSALDAPLATHAVTVDGDYAYVVGGLEADVTARVRRARVDDAGALGAWEDVTPMPRARAHLHQVPVLDHRLYAVSGNAGEHVTTPDVSIGALR